MSNVEAYEDGFDVMPVEKNGNYAFFSAEKLQMAVFEKDSNLARLGDSVSLPKVSVHLYYTILIIFLSHFRFLKVVGGSGQ